MRPGDQEVVAAAGPDNRSRWLMVLRGAACYNMAVGCLFGSAAVSLIPFQQRFETGRAQAAMCLALVILALGSLGPVVVWMIRRFGQRTMMFVGLSLSIAGYLTLAFAPVLWVALAAFALLIGPGMAMIGPLPANILASGWIAHRRGLAVSLANIQLLGIAMPPTAAAIISDFGLPYLYLFLAGLHLLLIPVIFGIADPPGNRRAQDGEGGATRMVTVRHLLHAPWFWVVVICGGLLSSIATNTTAHIAAIMIEKGTSAATAAGLVSVIAAAGIVGVFSAGPVSERIGAARVLSLAATILLLCWATIFMSKSFGLLAVAATCAGVCNSLSYPAINMLAVERCGAASVGRVLGLFGLLIQPITFVLMPTVGALHDIANSYDPVILAIIVICAGLATAFAVLSRRKEGIVLAT